ncbi:hypothetical protein Lbir_2295 [Legionella birminghamensis]|uniref:Uncharacterized protein n=1 Tax=Legionella birminghamensis TaxID=28083 RepID=A0A378I5W7_9GAMM|nr:hypothetical protein [Legionella birminghamensis]KTC68762.1 hypothetical protein Lbir_2295 [Legionella birminghamensis]STX30252.1 Uncharacterised protein [Legionella birminghamensis]
MKFTSAELAEIAKTEDAYKKLFADNSIDESENQEALAELDEDTQRLLATNVISHCPEDELRNVSRQTTGLAVSAASVFAKKLQAVYEINSRIRSITDINNAKPHKLWTGKFDAKLFHPYPEFVNQLLGDSENQNKIAHILAEKTPAEELTVVLNNMRNAFASKTTEAGTKIDEDHEFCKLLGNAIDAAIHMDFLIDCKDDEEFLSHLQDLHHHFHHFPRLSNRITPHLETISKRVAGMKEEHCAQACLHLSALSPNADAPNVFAHIADFVHKNRPAQADEKEVKEKASTATVGDQHEEEDTAQTHHQSTQSDHSDEEVQVTPLPAFSSAKSAEQVNPGKSRFSCFGSSARTAAPKDEAAYESDEEEAATQQSRSCFGWGSSK